jgi:CheY-like chemotaxis protein
MEHHRAVNILLVEDNRDHADLTRRALKEGNLLNEIFWVKDGEEALDFLFRRGRYTDPAAAPRPGLILLDIKLPKLGGHEVLRQVKNDEVLRSIPVVILTTSDRDEEVKASYLAGANSYVCKPVKFAEFVAQVKSVKLYWVLTNMLPDP